MVKNWMPQYDCVIQICVATRCCKGIAMYSTNHDKKTLHLSSKVNIIITVNILKF